MYEMPTIYFYVSNKELEQIVRRAMEDGMGLSEWVKKAVLEKAGE